jgi:hypothetical protein
MAFRQWVRFRPLPSGDHSKFYDYFLSVGEELRPPVSVSYDEIDLAALSRRIALPKGSRTAVEGVSVSRGTTNAETLFSGIRDANYHEGGIRCPRIFQVDERTLARCGKKSSGCASAKPVQR